MLRTLIFSTTSAQAMVSGENQSETKESPVKEDSSSGTYQRRDTEFISKGCRCVAWLYLPDGVKNPPVVVMAHGLGGERKYRLDAYADRFAQRNMACFVFEYRGFGESEGKTRKNINPFRHLEDWEAAIAHVRTLDSVDTGRIALWGTSFSAGHVIVMAARHQNIRAIVGQVPFVDGISSSMNNAIPYVLKATFHATLDIVTCILTLGKKRHRVRYVAEPGTFAVLNTADCYSGILKLIPEGTNPEEVNYDCPAMIFATLPIYRPTSYAKKVNCPALIMYSDIDSLIPASAVRKAISKMKHGHGHVLPGTVGHFDPYVGEEFETTSSIQAGFLETCFNPAS